jgi:hypothetical protein
LSAKYLSTTGLYAHAKKEVPAHVLVAMLRCMKTRRDGSLDGFSTTSEVEAGRERRHAYITINMAVTFLFLVAF